METCGKYNSMAKASRFIVIIISPDPRRVMDQGKAWYFFTVMQNSLLPEHNMVEGYTHICGWNIKFSGAIIKHVARPYKKIQLMSSDERYVKWTSTYGLWKIMTHIWVCYLRETRHTGTGDGVYAHSTLQIDNIKLLPLRWWNSPRDIGQQKVSRPRLYKKAEYYVKKLDMSTICRLFFELWPWN